MEDFKIRRGLSSTLFISPGVVNPRLIKEAGCWYLCTDTAELFLCVETNAGDLTLKRINGAESINTGGGPSNDNFGGEPEPNYEFLISELDERITSLEAVELFKKITNETDLPTNFEDESFNPNVTYYIQKDEYCASTFIFDKIAKAWLCTNSAVIPNSVLVTNVDINAAGELVIYYSNGDSSILGNITNSEGTGASGKDGETPYIKDGYWWIGEVNTSVKAAGSDGKDGISITSAAINTEGELVLVLSDATEIKVGKVVGSNGTDGLTTAIKIGGALYNQVGGVIELPDFATRAFVEEQIHNIKIPEVPSKVSELENDLGYITQHQDLSEYAKKTELPSLDGFATEAFVRHAINEAELGDKIIELEGYATKDDIKDLASESYVDEKIATIKLPESFVLYGGDATPED